MSPFGGAALPCWYGLSAAFARGASIFPLILYALKSAPRAALPFHVGLCSSTPSTPHPLRPWLSMARHAPALFLNNTQVRNCSVPPCSCKLLHCLQTPENACALPPHNYDDNPAEGQPGGRGRGGRGWAVGGRGEGGGRDGGRGGRDGGRGGRGGGREGRGPGRDGGRGEDSGCGMGVGLRLGWALGVSWHSVCVMCM